MKTKISFLLAIFLLPFVAFASIDQNLKYSSTGQEVTELQEYLIDKGFLQGSATGNFFSLTKSAVIKYQQSVGLPMTGFVGTMTREKINADLALNTSEEETQATAVVTPSNDTSLLQKQLDALTAQLAQLVAEQKKTNEQAVINTQAIQQTTQAVQDVVINTTPTFGATTVKVPVKKLELIGSTFQAPGFLHLNPSSYPVSDGSTIPIHGQIKFSFNYTIDDVSQYGLNHKSYIVKSDSVGFDQSYQLTNPYAENVIGTPEITGITFDNTGTYNLTFKVYEVESNPNQVTKYTEITDAPTVTFKVFVQ